MEVMISGLLCRGGLIKSKMCLNPEICRRCVLTQAQKAHLMSQLSNYSHIRRNLTSHLSSYHNLHS